MTTAISTMNPAPPADMPMMAISDSTAEGGRERAVRVVLGIRRREGGVRMAVSLNVRSSLSGDQNHQPEPWEEERGTGEGRRE